MATEEDVVEMNILELADELLLHIFTKLPSFDLLNVAKVCQRFHCICCDKNVVGRLNLTRQYGLSYAMLTQFLHPKIRYLNIVGINLNHCYWFLSTQLQFLSKLKNLKHLEVLDCRVTLKSLLRIIKGLQLQTLSWTWDDSVARGDLNKMCLAVFKSSLCHLHNLTVQVESPFQLSQVCFLLQFCKELRYLSVCESATSLNDVNPMPSTNLHILLPQLRELRFTFHACVGYGVEQFIFKILSSALPSENLRVIWTYHGSCSVFGKLYEQNLLTIPALQTMTMLSLDGYRTVMRPVIRCDRTTEHVLFMKKVLQLGGGLQHTRRLSLDCQRLDKEVFEAVASNCRSLQSLSLRDCQLQDSITNVNVVAGLKIVMDVCQNISELNLLGTHFHSYENPCLSLVNAKNLITLVLPTCFIAPQAPSTFPSDSCSMIQGRNAGVREGAKTTFTVEEIKAARLFLLTVNCPKIKNLVIRMYRPTSTCEMLCKMVGDKDLMCISNWTSLETLAMQNFPGASVGNFVAKICECCPELRYLNLCNIGPKSCFKYSSSLLHALQFCRNLKDFRLVQMYDVSLRRLEDVLVGCQNLERLTVFSEEGVPTFELSELINFVEQLPKLIALYVVLPASAKHCKSVSHGLEKAFITTRPAFTCGIAPTKANLLHSSPKLPNCHREEIIDDTCLFDNKLFYGFN